MSPIKKILMLVNWGVHRQANGQTLQSPNLQLPGEPYWFFKHWPEPVQVDVIDYSSLPVLHKLERFKLKFYVWQLLKALPKMKDYDLILSHGAQSGVLLAFLRALLGNSKTPPHIIIDVGCFNGGRNDSLELAPLKFASQAIAGVISHTSKQSVYYKFCLPRLADKFRFVPFGTDPDFFAPSNSPEEDYIVCVGYIKRDWETLLAAFTSLNTGTTLKLVGAEGKLKLPSTVQASKRIECLPYVPIRTLQEIIRRSKAVILPLPYYLYSFGQMTLLQSMALGKPVIVTNVPGVADYVADGQTALLVRPYDPYELKDKMEQVLASTELRARIGRAARNTVVEKFNEKNMAEGIYRSCNELIGN